MCSYPLMNLWVLLSIQIRKTELSMRVRLISEQPRISGRRRWTLGKKADQHIYRCPSTKLPALQIYWCFRLSVTQTFIRLPYIEFYILTDSGGACNESKEGPFATVKPSRRRAKHQSSRYVRASCLLASSKETYSLYYLLPHLSCLVASARTTGDPLGCRTGTPRRDARARVWGHQRLVCSDLQKLSWCKGGRSPLWPQRSSASAHRLTFTLKSPTKNWPVTGGIGKHNTVNDSQPHTSWTQL